MKTLNLGILAHVDAGKTSLTERLLFNAGVIATMGSVDLGNTQTDSLELERERGITIQSAVVSFTMDDLTVHLIDTPGHSDFIGEVERALKVLDGAILVVSAVEGIQAQTRILMQTLKKLNIPTLIFVNKIDRRGACYEELIEKIKERLSPYAVAMCTVSELATPQAKVAAIHNLFTDQIRSGKCHPIFFGSAITGAGISELQWGIYHLLPSLTCLKDAPLRGTIFKIERGPQGEKIAYLRLYAGQVRVRQTLTLYQTGKTSIKEKVTAIHRFQKGTNSSVEQITAGHIAKIKGLHRAKIGDQLHPHELEAKDPLFCPPTLETVIYTEDKALEPKLFSALQSMAEQDPWINARVDPSRNEITVSLYGEVQKQVIQARLEQEFGLHVLFKETTTIYIERICKKGEALQQIHRRRHNEFWAEIGLRVEPAEAGSGIVYRLGVEWGCIPKSYHTAIEESVFETLKRGLYGWEITDCVVTLFEAGICPLSTASEFRKSAPLLLMQAIQQAGTCVCEPMAEFELEASSSMLSMLIVKLIESGAVIEDTKISQEIGVVMGRMPANRVHQLEKQLPGMTQGSALFFSRFAGYDPVKGKIPSRDIFDGSLIDRRKLRKQH
ncbi:MAG: TetM/TetW/TetO/TetS family tetracycline resistance ribosomal protection protein [Rhabdochlamydiaceae bacterium]|nr:TetM/TetW/TetO/TetS family tetracycline resistance ribosomal protection protein [Rhabdochlamydiaceae bacterium]